MRNRPPRKPKPLSWTAFPNPGHEVVWHDRRGNPYTREMLRRRAARLVVEPALEMPEDWEALVAEGDKP